MKHIFNRSAWIAVLLVTMDGGVALADPSSKNTSQIQMKGNSANQNGAAVGAQAKTSSPKTDSCHGMLTHTPGERAYFSKNGGSLYLLSPAGFGSKGKAGYQLRKIDLKTKRHEVLMKLTLVGEPAIALHEEDGTFFSIVGFVGKEKACKMGPAGHWRVTLANGKQKSQVVFEKGEFSLADGGLPISYIVNEATNSLVLLDPTTTQTRTLVQSPKQERIISFDASTKNMVTVATAGKKGLIQYEKGRVKRRLAIADDEYAMFHGQSVAVLKVGKGNQPTIKVTELAGWGAIKKTFASADRPWLEETTPEKSQIIWEPKLQSLLITPRASGPVKDFLSVVNYQSGSRKLLPAPKGSYFGFSGFVPGKDMVVAELLSVKTHALEGLLIYEMGKTAAILKL